MFSKQIKMFKLFDNFRVIIWTFEMLKLLSIYVNKNFVL